MIIREAGKTNTAEHERLLLVISGSIFFRIYGHVIDDGCFLTIFLLPLLFLFVISFFLLYLLLLEELYHKARGNGQTQNVRKSNWFGSVFMVYRS